MIHYITLGDAERPISFDYSVAYEYEFHTGKFYENDVHSLARQIVLAGIDMGTDDTAVAARGVSIVKFVDILFACLLVGHRKTNTPITFTRHDVADWLGGNLDAVSRFTTMLLEANFSLPGEKSDEQNGEMEGETKKKSLAR